MRNQLNKKVRVQQLELKKQIKQATMESQLTTYYVSTIISPKTIIGQEQKLQKNNLSKNPLTQHFSQRQLSQEKQYFPQLSNSRQKRKETISTVNISPQKTFKMSVEPFEEDRFLIPQLKINYRLRYGYKKRIDKTEKNIINYEDYKLKNNRSISLFQEKQKDNIQKISWQVHQLLIKQNEQLSSEFENLEKQLRINQ